MTNAEHPKAGLLDELKSTNWWVVQGGVERTSELLRGRAGDSALVDALCDVADHPKWEVRKAAAYALLFVADDRFNAPISKLLKDENELVRSQANQTLSKRTAQRRIDPLYEEHGRLVRDKLAAIEYKHGPRARETCERVAGEYAELIVLELNHEVVRALAPLEMQLARLGSMLPTQDEALAVLKKARENCARITTVLASTCDYTCQVTPQLAPTDVGALIASAIETVHALVSAQFSVAIEMSEKIELLADHHRLSQALVNIIQNGVEASQDDGRAPEIRIEATNQSGAVMIRIADNGPGLLEVADALRLLVTSKPNGTGLGLPMAQKIIEAEHRGELTITSEPDVGTTVTIRIPNVREQTE